MNESNNDVPLLPWPTDAVMVVGAVSDEALTHKMTGDPIEVICRTCSAKLLVDSWTIKRSRMYAMGRLTKFFCVACAVKHQSPMESCDVVEDHRDGHEIVKGLKDGKDKRFLGNVFPHDYSWSDRGGHE